MRYDAQGNLLTIAWIDDIAIAIDSMICDVTAVRPMLLAKR